MIAYLHMSLLGRKVCKRQVTGKVVLAVTKGSKLSLNSLERTLYGEECVVGFLAEEGRYEKFHLVSAWD